MAAAASASTSVSAAGSRRTTALSAIELPAFAASGPASPAEVRYLELVFRLQQMLPALQAVNAQVQVGSGAQLLACGAVHCFNRLLCHHPMVAHCMLVVHARPDNNALVHWHYAGYATTCCRSHPSHLTHLRHT
jgi:hypothetical protein